MHPDFRTIGAEALQTVPSFYARERARHEAARKARHRLAVATAAGVVALALIAVLAA